jgi:hypothetical protein
MINEIKQAKDQDQVIEINVKGKVMRLRVLRFTLDSGIEEALATRPLLSKTKGIREFPLF